MEVEVAKHCRVVWLMEEYSWRRDRETSTGQYSRTAVHSYTVTQLHSYSVQSYSSVWCLRAVGFRFETGPIGTRKSERLCKKPRKTTRNARSSR